MFAAAATKRAHHRQRRALRGGPCSIPGPLARLCLIPAENALVVPLIRTLYKTLRIERRNFAKFVVDDTKFLLLSQRTTHYQGYLCSRPLNWFFLPKIRQHTALQSSAGDRGRRRVVSLQGPS